MIYCLRLEAYPIFFPSLLPSLPSSLLAHGLQAHASGPGHWSPHLLLLQSYRLHGRCSVCIHARQGESEREREEEGREEGRRNRGILPSAWLSRALTDPHSLPLSLPPSRPLSRWTFPSSLPARSTNPLCAPPPPPPAFPPALPPPFPLAAPSILFPLRGSHTTRATRIFPPSLSVRLQPLSLRLFLLLFLLTSGPVLLLVFLMLLAM